MSIDHVIRNLVGYEDTFHFESELRMLNRTLDQIHEGVAVTIGSYRGQADCAIALHAHIPVYAIDPRQGWIGESRAFGDEDRVYWMQNVMSLGLGNKLRPINLPSLDVAKIWNQPISFLFVDGNHTEVSADLDAWLPHVIDGGIVALHDANQPAIIQAYAARSDLVEIERADITAVFRKESLYEPFTYDGLTMLVRKGPYNKDDRYVLGEVRSYDIGPEPIRTCIDVGAQIGAFSTWIKSLWPLCKIVAVEPEISCYSLAKANFFEHEYYSDVLLNARVNYDASDKLLFVDPVNAGSHRVIDAAAPGLPYIHAPAPITLEQIMVDQGWKSLDLLKIDAEGAEVDILTNCTDNFLRSAKRVVGEFHFGHDAFVNGIGARLQALGFEVSAETNPAAHSTFLAVNRNWFDVDLANATVSAQEQRNEELAEGPQDEIIAEHDASDYRKPAKFTRKPKGKGR